jgi:hypothetical protein
MTVTETQLLERHACSFSYLHFVGYVASALLMCYIMTVVDPSPATTSTICHHVTLFASDRPRVVYSFIPCTRSLLRRLSMLELTT